MKYVVPLLIACATLLAHEAATTPPPRIDLFLGNPVYTFDLQFRPLCFQPISTTTYYAAEAFPLPLPSPDWIIFNVDPSYHFGFDLALGTVFHSRNIDLTLNWEYLNVSDSASMGVSLDSNMVGPFFEIGPDASSYKLAYGQNAYYLNALNLDSGIFINAGQFLESRLFTGVKGAYIKQTISSQYTDWAATTFRGISSPSSFFGAGPEIGSSFAYHIVENFCLVGQGVLSFLVGKQENSTTFTARSPALPIDGILSPNIQTTTINNGGSIGIVPELEGRIGLAYLASFSDHYAIHIELGYEALLYINALSSYDIGSEVVTAPVIPDTVGVFARTFEKHPMNFGFSGPYAMITFGF